VSNGERDKAGVVAPPPLIYLGPLVLGLLLNRKFPVPFLSHRVARILGWPLLGGGLLLGSWSSASSGTPVDPGEPVSSLVTNGPYRHTRNPGYLSMAMIYAGIASLANTLWAILFLPASLFMIQRGVIEREERYLERKFGDEFSSLSQCGHSRQFR
jgi:protein-S-isoprenylcysteine O-methyltransferase Ste14